jgi:hypothetical protein
MHPNATAKTIGRRHDVPCFKIWSSNSCRFCPTAAPPTPAQMTQVKATSQRVCPNGATKIAVQSIAHNLGVECTAVGPGLNNADGMRAIPRPTQRCQTGQLVHIETRVSAHSHVPASRHGSGCALTRRGGCPGFACRDVLVSAGVFEQVVRWM